MLDMTPPPKMNQASVRVKDNALIAPRRHPQARAVLPRPRRFSSLWQAGLMVLSDVAALAVAGFAAYLVWPRAELGQPLVLYAHLAPLLGLFPLIFAASSLYPGFGLGPAEIIRRLVSGTSLGFVILASASFALKIPPAYSRLAFALGWLLSIGMLPLMRFLVLSVARRFPWWGEPVVVIGDRHQIELTLGLISGARSLGYRAVGALCSEPAAIGDRIDGVEVIGGPELSRAVSEAGISTALVWDRWRAPGAGKASRERPMRIGWLQRQFRHVVILRGEEGLPVEHVQVRNLGTMLGIEFSNELLRPGNRFVKRLMDIVLGSIFLALSAPLIVVSGLAVKLLSRGPMFFRQEREGLDGRVIVLWKLRTMYADAEERLEEHLAKSPELRREWESKYKLTRDPRVVRGVGAFLRRFSIDELPQFLGVVNGTLSLVGPRPLPDYHLKIFSREFMELRRSVRPGVTGLWQVTVRNDGGLDEHQSHDSYYIRNWSVWLDLYILARTFFTVISAKGAC